MAVTTAKFALAFAAALATHTALAADPIGQIKTASGTASVERAGVAKAAVVGERVFESDTIVTGDGSVGITFADNSMMSLGPYSRLSLEQFKFDTTTQNGLFDSSLVRGTLSVKSGQIVRQTPGAMRVRTPAALLGVRGTDFVVRADDRQP